MVRLHVHVNVYALYVLLLVEEILDWSGRDGDNMMAALIINESFGIELRMDENLCEEVCKSIYPVNLFTLIRYGYCFRKKI